VHIDVQLAGNSGFTRQFCGAAAGAQTAIHNSIPRSSVTILPLGARTARSLSEAQALDYGIYRVRQATRRCAGKHAAALWRQPRQIIVDLDPQALLAKVFLALTE